jgi:hypothetical protein
VVHAGNVTELSREVIKCDFSHRGGDI